jgi:uncharacterized protein YqhQ
MQTKPENELNYGGQAVIEGVMMRGSKALAVAVRNPQGDIVVHSEPLNSRIYGGRMVKIPFVRGLTLLWDALGLGIKSLMFSADVAIDEEEENGTDPVDPVAANGEGETRPAGKILEADDVRGEPVLAGPVRWITVLFSLSASVGIFFLLPAFVAGLFESWLGISNALTNLIEGVIRLLLLIGYVSAISLMPDVKRLYGYHGAEHKTINAYEAGAKLIPNQVARFPIEHPRCGTAFLLTVVVISILIYSLFPPMGLALRLLSRLLLLPVIAGIAYEFIRFSARHQENAFIRLITRPNLALQRLTTREPDESMLEVAIVALERVLAYEHETIPLAETGDVTIPAQAG